MQITINGSVTDIPDGLSVRGCVEYKNLPAKAIIIELNNRIIKADQWESIKLNPQDILEIIRFVGGG
jgi:sulfur carrier protein